MHKKYFKNFWAKIPIPENYLRKFWKAIYVL